MGVHVSIDGVTQSDVLSSCGGVLTINESHPLTPRWVVGANGLIGWTHYKSVRENDHLTKCGGGITSGAGLNMTFLAAKSLSTKFFADYIIQKSPHGIKENTLSIFNLGASINIQF